MELSEYLVKVFLSLIVVVVAIVFLLPLVLRKSMGLKGFGGKGSFELKKVSPITKNVFIVELEVKGRTYVLCISERGADVIYREDGTGSDSRGSAGSGGSGPERSDTTD
ncbi:hypothetical protein [Hydrogenivirga sp. 128-5-R1-1]|uniref:hypothetical protein n=1 Tax=Hydrogenivirga sp. 128-5-R1-1 TaxID=392423 RepID=UPI00015F375F|nr:hypothetical protein [Hydrogenivirga sp. 128-5-R1-1]EDP76578.1 hypothetical protein HG1285_03188 [Hydrogenivirga sp. 128-5-R1-1]